MHRPSSRASKSAWLRTRVPHRKKPRRSTRRTTCSPTVRRICCTAPCRKSTATKIQAHHQRHGADRRRHDAQHHPRRAGEGQRTLRGGQESRQEIRERAYCTWPSRPDPGRLFFRTAARPRSPGRQRTAPGSGQKQAQPATGGRRVPQRSARQAAEDRGQQAEAGTAGNRRTASAGNRLTAGTASGGHQAAEEKGQQTTATAGNRRRIAKQLGTAGIASGGRQAAKDRGQQAAEDTAGNRQRVLLAAGNRET